MNNLTHPLKVNYPYGGEHYVLHFWTANKQNQIILSKKENNVSLILNRLLNKNFYLEVKGYYKLNIVGPSQDMIDWASDFKRKSDARKFVFDVIDTHRMHDADFSFLFEKCKKFESNDDDEENDEHYLCINCFNGFILKNSSPVEFFNNYSKQFYDFFSYLAYKDIANCHYSLAEMAKDDDKIFELVTGSFAKEPIFYEFKKKYTRNCKFLLYKYTIFRL